MSQTAWYPRKIRAAKDFITIMFAEGAFIAGFGAAKAPDTVMEALASAVRNPSIPNVVANALSIAVDATVIGGGLIMVYKAHHYFNELKSLVRQNAASEIRA